MDWFYNFPLKLSIDLEAIDNAVKGFSVKYDDFFSIVKKGLSDFVGSINNVLDFIPWLVLVLFVVIVTWKISGKIRNGLLYGLYYRCIRLMEFDD